jgi:hypothetical protein
VAETKLLERILPLKGCGVKGKGYKILWYRFGSQEPRMPMFLPLCANVQAAVVVSSPA